MLHNRSTCVTLDGEVAPTKFPSLALPIPGLELVSNSYGIAGRNTTLSMCLNGMDNSSTFGWNWTRHYTKPACVRPPCNAPECYFDFSFASVGFGVTPWGGSTGIAGLPVDTSTLASFEVLQNVSYSWVDDAPGVSPPPTGGSRRTRFLYDFFLTSTRPSEGTSVADSITDEVTIDLASDPNFPGSQPPGCLDPNSRFGKNGTYGPVHENAVWDGYAWRGQRD
jgi:hypothetical protein